MIKNAVFFTFIFLFINHSIAFTQTKKIEQAKYAFNNASDPVQKLQAAFSVCEQSHSLSTDTLSHYALLAKRLAAEANDAEKEIIANTFIENSLLRKNMFDSALKMCDQDLKHLKYATNSEAYSKSMIEKGYCYTRANRNTDALDLAFPFLADAEKYADTTSQLYIKTLIGIVYRNMQQTELAMQWFLKADSTAEGPAYEQIKNEYGIFFLIGMMYNWRLDAATDPGIRLQDSLKCIYYLDRSIEDSRRYENLLILAKSLNIKASTIGNAANAEKEGKYIKEASAIYVQLHDTVSMLNTISPMCFYYIDEGHPEKGVEASLQGIRIASKSNSFPILDLYEALSECYKAQGDNAKYAETLNAIITIKDSVYKANTEKDLAELNAKYEDQKKENIIINQKLDIASKKYSVLLFSILTVILLFGIALLYRYFYRKQKRLKQEQLSAIVAAEEAERKRISADLHDNLGAYAAAAASTISSIHIYDDQTSRRLGLLKTNVQNIITQLNDSIWALNKKDVLLTGVSDRFKIFVQKLEPAYPHLRILIHEEIRSDPSLVSFQALHLFRIMQEALNNALRHSGCTAVCINIQSDESKIKIIIEDNGTGMSATKKEGNGINNLKMRANELGWTATWITNDKGGTSVSIESSSPANTAN